MEHYSFNQICSLVELPSRTVRYYIQKGLVSPPEGSRKGAYYTDRHLKELLTVKKWQSAGLSLERIKELQFAETMPKDLPPPRSRRPGDLEVWSKLYLRDGLEIHLEPTMAGLSPEEVRRFCRGVMSLLDEIKGGAQ